MNKKIVRILLIEDSSTDAEFVLELFREDEESFHIDHVERLGEALQLLDRERFDVILSDLGLPDSRGLETFSRLQARGAAPIVVLTGMDDEALAVEALRKGAQDYLVKGSMDAGIIQRSLLYAIERSRLQTGPENGVLHGLLVEDIAADAEYIEETLRDVAFFRMTWRRAGSLAEALAAVDETAPDAVLLDLVVPDSSGLPTFTRFHAAHPDLPVIVLTLLGDEALAVRAVREGAQDFLVKGHFEPAFLARRIRFAIERSRSEREKFLRRKEAMLQGQLDFQQAMMDAMPCSVFYKDTAGRYLGCNQFFADYLGLQKGKIIGRTAADMVPKGIADQFAEKDAALFREPGRQQFEITLPTEKGTPRDVVISRATICGADGRPAGLVGVITDITRIKESENRLKQSYEQLSRTLAATVQAMAVTVEVRDPYTAGHQRQVSRLARAIAQEMGLDGDRIEGLRVAGSIHDIGKISIPAEILSKPTRLSEIEFGLIKVHPTAGYEILREIDFPWPVAQMVLQHHERLDGTGYPSGLKGEEILLEARILAVADVVDAMAMHRPYRPALGLEAAIAEIEANSGIKYDPAVADACLRLIREKRFVIGD